VSLAGLSIEEYARRLASSDPTPGGGSASAVVGAMGASLVRMVALLTLESPKYTAVAARAGSIARDAEALAREFLRSVDEDVTAFDKVSAAYKLPKASDAEKAARTAAIQKALLGACDPPLQAIALAQRTCSLAVELVDFGNPNAISDIGCAALFAHAAARGAALNIAINAKALKDESEAGRVLGRMTTSLAQVGLLAEVVNGKVKSAIGSRS
jgi:formiminotetrahydrofolate cyclodeaminase